LKQDCKVGMRVYFGRTHGEQTLGEIVKLNNLAAKVKQLEERGRNGNHNVGKIWGVPYSLMKPVGNVAVAVAPVTPAPVTPAPVAVKKPLPENHFLSGEDFHILQAILSCYASLSPENLSCDGEASAAHVRQRGSELRRKLNALFNAYGRTVDENEVYEWHRKQDKRA
jgi:hypothetical protein